VLTVTVKVEVMEPSAGGVTEFWLNDVVTPAGAPETERLTGELKALIEVTVMTEEPELPRAIVRDIGDAEMEKSGVGGKAVTVSERLTVRIKLLLVPVTVNE